MDDRQYARVTRRVRDLTGVDLERYDPGPMRQRLAGYFSLINAGDVEGYLDSIENDPDAREALRCFITVSASEFFRDPQMFEALEKQVLPELVRSKPGLTAWSAGCSSGAEAYSVAMVLEDVAPGVDNRVLGTDVDVQMLARARAGGPYAPAELANVSQRRLLKHFSPENACYRARPELRDTVSFRMHDLLQNEFEEGFDLILCRNVAIYLSVEARGQLMARFARALQEDGVLFVGATEAIVYAEALGLKHMHGPFYRRASA